MKKKHLSLENAKGFTLNIKVKSKFLGPFIFIKSKRFYKRKKTHPIKRALLKQEL